MIKSKFSKSFTRTVDRILNRRFTTSELETAHTISGAKHTISSIIYEKKALPKHVRGTVEYWVDTVSITIGVQWDAYGKCRGSLGVRLRKFDLVRGSERSIYSKMIIAEGTSSCVLVILLCLFSN